MNFPPHNPSALAESLEPKPGLRRYLGIYAALWRNSVVREMGFKTNFILWIVVELLWFALQLTVINVIYSHTDHISAGQSRDRETNKHRSHDVGWQKEMADPHAPR